MVSDTEDLPRGPASRPVFAAILATTGAALPAFLLGGVAVQVRADLGFSEGRLGLLVTVYFALSAFASTTAGRLTERLGVRRAMVIVAVIAALSLTGMAIAPSWWFLLLAIAVGAGSNAFAQPASNLLLARAVDRARQGFAFGLKQGAVPLTSLLGGLAVPVFALTVGWRWAFATGALLALSLILIVPRKVPIPTFPKANPATRFAVPALREGARRPLTLLAVAAFFGNFGSNALGVFLVEHVVQAGSPEAFGGTMLMLGSVFGIISRVSLGRWADRSARPVFFATASLMLFGGGLGYLLLASGRSALLVPALILTFGAGWGWNGLFSYSVVTSHREAPAAATGIAQSGLFLGAMAGPGVFGVVVERVGFPTAWTMLAVSMVVASTLMLVGSRRIRLVDDTPPRTD